MRRPERAAAALLLAVLGGSLGLLANPSGPASASVSGDDIKASIRYGCSGGGWVEVTINSRADQLQNSSDEQQLFQVGLTAPGSSSSDGPYPEGGPSQVVAGEVATTIRLAGAANAAEAVFIKRVATGEVKTIPLPGDCRNRMPTDFGLNDPNLKVASVTCMPGAQARLQAQIANPNELNWPTARLGLNEIDYTVLLVRTADNALMAPTQGELMRFDGPGQDSVALAAPAASSAKYEVRVIGVDGSVVTSNELAVNCAHLPSGSPTATPPPTSPTPTPTATPTPSPKPTPTVTPTKPAPSPTSTQPAPQSSAVSQSSEPVPGGPATQAGSPQPVSNPGISSSTQLSSSASRSSSSAVAVTPTSPSAPSPSSGVTPSGTLRHLTLTDPARNSPQRIFVWQRNIGLVVLLDAAAIAGLVGATVVSARRR